MLTASLLEKLYLHTELRGLPSANSLAAGLRLTVGNSLKERLLCESLKIYLVI